MSGAGGAAGWRRIAAALRFTMVAVAVSLLALAMLGAMAIGIIAAVAVLGTLLGR